MKRTKKIILPNNYGTINSVSIGGPAWEYRANYIARKACPPIIPCPNCKNPVITGQDCSFCKV